MQIEVDVVLPTNAIVNPWTVVVKLLYTSVTEVAVSAPWKSYNFTKWA
jgi:hypothetical protein